MKLLFRSIWFLLIVTSLKSQNEIKPYNKGLIWRGFEHSWTYNHRINRIGNYVTYKDGVGKTTHTSASGLGSDSTFATTYYTYIESPDIYFKEAEIKILLNGLEGDLLTKEETLYVDLDPWMQAKDHYGAFLNGFEIKSVKKADQLQLFRFLLEDPLHSEVTNQVQLTAHFNLVTNCRTIECELLKNITAYELTLHVLIFAYDEGAASFNNSYTARNYVWDTKVEVEDLDKKLTVKGQQDKFPFATAGLKGMGFVLDEEHWLLEMDNYVTPLNYNQESGELDTHINMKFVEWTKGMDMFAVSPFKASFAKRRSGFALLDTNVYMVQFTNAKIKHGKQTCRSYWKGWNKSASSKEAESTTDISEKLHFNK